MTETIRANILKEYRLTESDIKQLPNQWIPSEFGGIGFTKAIIVE